jgi:hypothetical protein
MLCVLYFAVVVNIRPIILLIAVADGVVNILQEGKRESVVRFLAGKKKISLLSILKPT